MINGPKVDTNHGRKEGKTNREGIEKWAEKRVAKNQKKEWQKSRQKSGPKKWSILTEFGAEKISFFTSILTSLETPFYIAFVFFRFSPKSAFRKNLAAFAGLVRSVDFRQKVKGPPFARF